MVDLNDLLNNNNNNDNDVGQVFKMLLRHNSSMKIWYKFLCSKYENTIGENAFAMDFLGFWKFIQESQILD